METNMVALSSTNTIGVIGAGTMGIGVAQIAATHGHQVRLVDQNSEAIERSIKLMIKGLDKLVSRDRINIAERDAIVNRISSSSQLQDLSDCSLIVEAVVEDLKIKQGLFKQLEAICPYNTILATNTSSISITEIGAALKRPENFVGMHFFNPAPIMKLVEVISGKMTSKSIAETITNTATAWGKKVVQAKSTPGFIVNRVARPFYAESLRLLEEGVASAASIDAVIKESANFRMGPFELMDLIGNDVNYSVTKTIYKSYYQDQRFSPSILQKELVDGGLLGRKSGQGFYQYGDNVNQAIPDSSTSSYKPNAILIEGSLGIASNIANLAKSYGISVNKSDGNGFIKCGDAVLSLTDGRTASKRAKENNTPNTILFDLMFDYEANPRIAIAAAIQASDKALEHAIGFFQALEKTVTVLQDTPGLCVMRTVCMLANEGADATYQGVCDVPAVDNAMVFGLNYPRGPLEWADKIGLAHVCQVLSNIKQAYGTDRYRTSLLLQQLRDANMGFYE
jgi:3-hydroxybutyryl-CoA dehydrogenase